MVVALILMGVGLTTEAIIIARLVFKIRALKIVNASLSEKDMFFIRERLTFLSLVSQLRLMVDIMNLESCKKEMIKKENYEGASQITQYIDTFTQFNTYKFKY